MESELRTMVSAFRVTELQTLLSYAGKNKTGRKNELQARALELVKSNGTKNHIAVKIRELYRSIQQLEWLNCFELHSVVWKSLNLLQYKVCLDHFEAKYKIWRGAGSNMKVSLTTSAIPTLNLGEAVTATLAQPRAAPVATTPTPARTTRSSARLSTLSQLPPASASVPNPGHHNYPHSTTSSSSVNLMQPGRLFTTPGAYGSAPDKLLQVLQQNQQWATSNMARNNPFGYNTVMAKLPGLQALGHGLHGLPICPDVRMKRLPFYDIITELHKPTSLISQGGRVPEANFPFCLTPIQAGDIASSKEYTVTSYGEQKIQYGIQVQLRFCGLDTSCDQEDLFPPSMIVKVNNKLVPLPHSIPSNRPGVEPKRPSRPLNVTNYVKLSPTVTNSLNVTWASDSSGRVYTMSLYLVKKLDSKVLLTRLKNKGIRQADFTRGMIKDICQKDDTDCCVATTSLKVSIACPLGKCRMSLPCRASTCSHLQCFDANLFLQMNEKKPTWLCPVCDKPLLFDSLAIDGYFDEVIKKVPDANGNDVEILPDGSWIAVGIKKESDSAPPAKKLRSAEPSRINQTINLDDDSIIEDDDVQPVKSVNKSVEASSTSDTSKTSSKSPDIVDLTLSSSGDEAEEENGEFAQTQSDDDDEIILRKRVNKPNYIVDDTSSSSSSSSSTSTKAPDISEHQSSSPACIILGSPSPSPEPREEVRSGSRSSSTSAYNGSNYASTSSSSTQSRPAPSSSLASFPSTSGRFNETPLAHSSSSPFNLQSNMPGLGSLSFGGMSGLTAGPPLTRSQSNALERANHNTGGLLHPQTNMGSMVFPASVPTYLPFDSRNSWDSSYPMATDFTALDYPSMDYFNQTTFNANTSNLPGSGNGPGAGGSSYNNGPPRW